MNSSQSFYPSDLSDNFCVFAADSYVLSIAKSFAEKLQVQVFSYQDISDPYQLAFPFVFVYEGERAQIIQTGKSAPGPVTASFLQGKTTHQSCGCDLFRPDVST